MAEKQMIVVARLKAKSGMEEKLRQELLALVPPSRKDRGCIVYNLHQGPENKSLFMFYEIWASKKDLEVHAEQPHFKAFLQKADGLLAEPMDATFWEIIS